MGLPTLTAAGSLTLAGSIAAGAGVGLDLPFSGTLFAGGSIGDAFKVGIRGAVIGGVTVDLTYGVGHGFGGEWQGFEKTTWSNVIQKSVPMVQYKAV